MHAAWIAADLDPARFWDITLREAEREMQAATRRAERHADEQTWLAWHIVALDRTKKLPKLETLLRRSGRSKRRQTEEEKLFAMKSIFLAFGGNPKELGIDL